MRKTGLTLVLLVMTLGSPCKASIDDDLSLFDSSGKPIAYVGEGLTIYLWSGKPVAYMTEDIEGGFDIYGFNGKHLGWFVKGIVRDHRGNAVGGIEDVFSSSTKLEPMKGLKELKQLKSLKELAPLRPLFTRNWSDIPLKLFLLAGEE